jgi:putative transposase
MLTQKSYKFRLYPTEEQAKQLAKEFGCARFVWNRALVEREYAYQQWGVSLNSQYDISKHITQYKKTEKYSFLNDATGAVLTQKLIDQDKAFANFFKGRTGFPKFKKKHHAQSIRYSLDSRQNNYSAGEMIKLPKLGELNIKWSQIPNGTPKMVTVSKSASGKYFVVFACEVNTLELPKTGNRIGVDVGIKDVIVTSDGFRSGAPKFTYYYQRKLKKAQRNLSRKTKGSNRWNKQRLVVAKLHELIANSRKDFLHKLTTKLVKENDLICLEDLNVAGMLKNHKLSKAVADVGIFELNRQIKYKASWYGKEVEVIDRWYPSSKTCSACGQSHLMPLNKRVMSCDCGNEMDRDLNAAINIRTVGEIGLARRASNQSAIAQTA